MKNKNVAKSYRQATTEELNFCKNIFYPLQDMVFEVASLYGDKIYLTGGTALARFYFDHRLSDDLDFFTPTDDLKMIANDMRLRLIDAGYIVEVSSLEIYFARFFVVQDDVKLKVEFAKEFNLFDALVKTDKNIFVNSLEDIGGNKVMAFEDRATIKDVIDLYYITQRVSWERLFEIADTKRVPVAYENLLTFNIEGITGQALIRRELSPEELTTFINELKQEVEAEVKKKERLKTETVDNWLHGLLWDFPREKRTINEYSIPVLRRRLKKLPLPERRALEKVLS
jgi:predicted nucleotidyltransferase component of viral defense system